MIAITRRSFRRFRAACSRCTAGRARGSAPPVVLRQNKGRITLTVTFPEVTLELALPTPANESETLVVPMAVLDEIGSTSVELAELESTGMLKGTARWHEGVRTKMHPIDLILPGKQHDSLPRPQELKTVSARLLEALHEAGRTSSREDGRYALSRVQVRGAQGQVIATDGKVAVIFEAFSFPFTEDVLVPAVPLFGCPEVGAEKGVRVGRTRAHLVVSVGDWTVWLSVASSGKFPDVAAAIPTSAPTNVALDRADVARVLPQLPQLPGQTHEHRPVTLDTDKFLTVCGYDEQSREQKDIALAQSAVTGPATRVVLDRRALARILALGCNTLKLTPDKALVGMGDQVTVLVAPLDPQLAAPAKNTSKSITGPAQATAPIPDMNPERSTMKSDTNGTTHNGHRQPRADELLDPLAAAEELRDALGAVLTKVTQLITALKATRKEKKVLSSIWAGLKQLNLPSRNGGSS